MSSCVELVALAALQPGHFLVGSEHTLFLGVVLHRHVLPVLGVLVVPNGLDAVYA